MRHECTALWAAGPYDQDLPSCSYALFGMGLRNLHGCAVAPLPATFGLSNRMLDSLTEITKEPREIGCLVVSIEAARVGEKPDPSGPDGLGLRTNRCRWLVESSAIGTEPYNGEKSGLKPEKLPAENLGTTQNLRLR
jgi:hypothetical protein